MSDIRSVTLDQFVAAPRERVWAALDRARPAGALVGARRLAGSGRFSLQMGSAARSRARWSRAASRVRRHVQHLVDAHLAARRRGERTRRLLEHSGFDLDDPQGRYAFENMGMRLARRRPPPARDRAGRARFVDADHSR